MYVHLIYAIHKKWLCTGSYFYVLYNDLVCTNFALDNPSADTNNIVYNIDMKRWTIVILVLFCTTCIGAYGWVISQPKYSPQRLSFEQAIKKISYYAQDQVATVLYAKSEKVTVPVPFLPQEHPLTCETASLRMALHYRGEEVTEEELLDKLTFDIQDPLSQKGVWGDPDKGFVGNIDGSIYHGTGYGVYETPIRNLALYYRNAQVIEDATLQKILTQTTKGNPVIVWGLLSDKDQTYWRTKKGKSVQAFYSEHARVVIGYSGTVAQPKNIILMDPIYGKIRMSRDKFVDQLNTLNNRAVVIY